MAAAALLLATALGLGWWLEGCDPAERDARPSAAATAQADVPAYDRDAWPHWSDADRDCQDTRQEVLAAESEIPVKFRDGKQCAVASGRWRCPYTGKVITDPRQLDVDHLVPLHEAHRAGGHAWDREERERFANALDDPMHLVAVDKTANRSKGDKPPHRWMPPNPDHRCEYLRAWVDVKERWGLSQSEEERAYVDAALADCSRGRTPAAP